MATAQLDLGEMHEPEAVATAFKVSKGVVYRAIHSGELFALKIGSQFRIPDYALRAWAGIPEAQSDPAQLPAQSAA